MEVGDGTSSCLTEAVGAACCLGGHSWKMRGTLRFLVLPSWCKGRPSSPVHSAGSPPSCLGSLTPREFNSYGSRRGNDAIMARGTFANIRLLNKFLNKQAPQTIHLPSGEVVSVVTSSGPAAWESTRSVTFLRS